MAAFTIRATSPNHLAASGALDISSADEALRAGLRLIPHGGACTIDLSQVVEADSAGLAVLVEWMATARSRDAAIRYLGIPAQILAVARISDLEDLLTEGAATAAPLA